MTAAAGELDAVRATYRYRGVQFEHHMTDHALVFDRGATARLLELAQVTTIGELRDRQLWLRCGQRDWAHRIGDVRDGWGGELAIALYPSGISSDGAVVEVRVLPLPPPPPPGQRRHYLLPHHLLLAGWYHR